MSIDVLYNDCHLLIAVKPAGMPSQPDKSGQADLLTVLSCTFPQIKLVHRLDTPTGGLMVFGLTPPATAALSKLVQDHTAFCKAYLAVIPTPLSKKEGELTDHLYHDQKQNRSFCVSTPRKGTKEAHLAYRTLAVSAEGHALLSVRLFTGRTHQIRVQMAARGRPLVGDGKYGSREKCPYFGLWAASLSFPHPITGRPIEAYAPPPIDRAPWSSFQELLDAKRFENSQPIQ